MLPVGLIQGGNQVMVRDEIGRGEHSHYWEVSAHGETREISSQEMALELSWLH